MVRPCRHPAHVLPHPRRIRHLAEFLLPLDFSSGVFRGISAKSDLSGVDSISRACKQGKTGDGPSHGVRTPLNGLCGILPPRLRDEANCYRCQCIFQPRYRVAASWTGAAVEEKFAATWCSNPFSQIYRNNSCIFGISTTPAPPKVCSGSLVKAPSPT